MRGGEYVVDVGIMKELQPGIHQLEPDADRECAADHAADQREDEVHRADVFVVGRIDVAPPATRMIVCAVVFVSAKSFRRRSHDSRPSNQSVVAPLALSAVAPHHRAGERAADATLVGGAVSSRAYLCFACSTQVAKACSFTTRTAIGM